MKVQIQHFQSIENASLEPEGFTLIVGDSNIGKSSVIRALVGTLANELDASSIRKGKTGAMVVIEHEGHTIIAERSESTTQVTVDGQKFSKLARKLCPAVERLGFRPVQIGDTELTPQWIKDQFLPLFILDKPPSVAAGIITQATRLDVVSRASKAGAVELKQKKTLQKTREADRAAVLARLEGYKTVPQLSQNSQKLEQALQILKASQADYRSVASFRVSLTRLCAEEKILLQVQSLAIPPLPDSDPAQISVLRHLKRDLFFCRTRESLLREKDSCQIPDLGPLEVSMKEWANLNTLRSSLEASTREKAQVVERRQQLDLASAQLQLDETALRKEIKACPLCGTRLDAHVLCDV